MILDKSCPRLTDQDIKILEKFYEESNIEGAYPPAMRTAIFFEIECFLPFLHREQMIKGDP